MEFEAIILSTGGDFLVEKTSELSRDDKGVTLKNPWVINEEEKAQQVQAEKIFIPYNNLDNIQHGDFIQKVAE